jgi:transcriptional regulator with XRE-family HTH domain
MKLSDDPRATTDVDIAIGALMRARREQLGVPQRHVAEEVGISFQQLQKYESGDNRVSAAMLTKIAQALNVEPSELLPGVAGKAKRRAAKGPDEDALGLQLQAAYRRITSKRARRLILDLARRLGGADPVAGKRPPRSTRKVRR